MGTPQDVTNGKPIPKCDKDDKLVELQQTIKSLQVLDLLTLYAFVAFTAVGTISIIICSLKGTSLEEAGLLLNAGFWGGLGLALLFMLHILIVTVIQSWKLEKLTCEFEEERLRRGYEPVQTNSSRELYQKCIRSCRKAVGLPLPPQIDAMEYSKKIEGDHLLELQYKLKNWQFPSPSYRYTGQLFTVIGSISSILRWHNNWSYDELSLRFYVCFFGGYIIGSLSMAASLWFSYMSQRKFDATLQEFKLERARRGVEPRSDRYNVETSNAGTC